MEKNILNKGDISGPINIIRLEGKINNIKKTLYILGDNHTDKNTQKKCLNYSALHITQVLDKFIKKSSDFNTTWDFMIEGFLNSTVNNSFNIKEDTNYHMTNKNYLDEVREIMTNYLNVEIKNNNYKEYKILKSNKFNIRFHAVDPRLEFSNYFKFRVLFDLLFNQNSKGTRNSKNTMINHIINLINLLYNELNNISSEKKLKIYNKLFNSYKNDQVKKLIVNYLKKIVIVITDNIEKLGFLEDDIKANIKEVNIKYYNDLNLPVLNNSNGSWTWGEPYDDKNIKYIDKKIIEVYRSLFDSLNTLLDLNFLRRFLDKNYISNCILYCGIWHFVYLTKTLVSDFNFKITHIYYSKTSIDKINKIVKDSSFHDLIPEFYPITLTQCSSLEGFPDMFL